METKKIRAVITGVTGMVGEGVLLECLQHPDVEAVLVITRKPCGVVHPKLKEIIHPDFYDFSSVETRLSGYNACFFCLGVSSVGMKEPDYFKVTYTLTMHVAETLSKLNKDMVFCYVSGAATDSSEKGRLMWARVKGKTENDLRKLPFKGAYGFRPSFMKPTPGQKNTLSYYKYVGWMYPVFRPFFPGFFGTIEELGLAMISTAKYGFESPVLEVKDIRLMAGKSAPGAIQ